MKVINSLREAEAFVTNQIEKGVSVRWDNYDIVFFRPDERGYFSKNGAFRGGRWGFDNRSPLTDSGTWLVDERNIRI